MLIHRAILKLIGAASKDSARFQLNGIRVEEKDGKVEACATSGKMLATIVHPVEPNEDFPSDKEAAASTPEPVTLTRRFVDKVSRIVKSAGSPFKPILGWISLRQPTDSPYEVEAEVIDDDMESTCVTGKAIEGTFPDYRQVTGKPQNGLKVRLDPAILLSASKLLQDLVKELGTPVTGPTVFMEVPENVDKDGFVCEPVHLTYTDPDGVEAKVLVMPLVQV